jgi:Flp pilus assembly pilin Flp
MHFPRTQRMRKSIRQRGQSMTEYAVVCGAIALALGLSMTSDDSVLKQFFNAIALAYDKFSYAISLVL